MSVGLYMDVHVAEAITTALAVRGVAVLTAQVDGFATASNAELLDTATTLGRLLFTQDRHFIAEAARRQRSGQRFSGIIYAHQLRVSIG